MTTVVLRKGESQERLLKRFRKKVAQARILTMAKRKRFFISKSEQRRIARRKAIRRARRRERKRRLRGY